MVQTEEDRWLERIRPTLDAVMLENGNGLTMPAGPRDADVLDAEIRSQALKVKPYLEARERLLRLEAMSRNLALAVRSRGKGAPRAEEFEVREPEAGIDPARPGEGADAAPRGVRSSAEVARCARRAPARPRLTDDRRSRLAMLVVAGRGAAWLARLTGGQKVAGSNPAGPTDGREQGHRVGLSARADGPEPPVVPAHLSHPRLRRADRRIPIRRPRASCCSAW